MSPADGGARLRAEAARAVHGVVVEKRSLDETLPAAERQVAERERPLLRFLCYGVLRHHFRLRAQIAGLLTRPLKERDRIVESLLAVGLLQLAESRVAPHAAVSATVDAARLLRRPQFATLVNAVLRRFQREAPGIPGDDEEGETGHPAWMLERLRRDWPRHWREIVAANNARAPMWLRVNTARLARDEYRAELEHEAQVLDGLDAALKLDAPCAVDELPGFAEGRVSVQDGAAQIAAPWLLAGGGRRLLDACAAPGGKTGHLGELAGPEASLTAIDRDVERLERVRETLTRLGLDATVRNADASNPRAWWDGETFDRILLDAPCSGSGVIRRRPDIRHLRRETDIAAMATVQSRLLEALWPLLEAGGRLLYVTCSVFAEENDALGRRFLDTHPDAREDLLLPNNNIRALMHQKPVGFQVLPGQSDLDGFYFASLTKGDDASA